MFQFLQCAAHTYYLRCFSNIGVYELGNGDVILIDSGDHRKSVSDLDAALNERGWHVKAIVNTHCHTDHIVGNRFFKEKDSCEIYAPEIERFFVEHSTLEPTYFYLSVPTNRKRNFFFKPYGTPAKLLTQEVLPAGFEVLPLPGHSLNMAAIKTPDHVWFLSDAILSEDTFRDYKLPSFYEINASIASARRIAELDGAFFVPAHAPATTDIRPLAQFNAEALEALKDVFLRNCDGRSFEEIFCAVSAKLGMTMDLDKYAKVSLTSKCFLQALLDDGAISAHMEGAKLIYTRL